MSEKEKEETAEQKLRKIVRAEMTDTLKNWKMELPEHTHTGLYGGHDVTKEEKPVEEKIEECPQRIQRLETALGNLIAYLDQQTKQPAGNLGQPQQQQGDLQALLALAGPLLKEPDPMQQLTLTFLQGAVQNQNAMAQATINLANSIATIFVKKKIEGETT